MPHPRQETPYQALRAIGRAVRFARLDAGLTQKQLSEEVGVSRGTIANIERGSQNTTLGLIWAICMTCEVTIEDLMAAAVRAWK